MKLSNADILKRDSIERAEFSEACESLASGACKANSQLHEISFYNFRDARARRPCGIKCDLSAQRAFLLTRTMACEIRFIFMYFQNVNAESGLRIIANKF